MHTLPFVYKLLHRYLRVVPNATFDPSGAKDDLFERFRFVFNVTGPGVDADVLVAATNDRLDKVTVGLLETRPACALCAVDVLNVTRMAIHGNVTGLRADGLFISDTINPFFDVFNSFYGAVPTFVIDGLLGWQLLPDLNGLIEQTQASAASSATCAAPAPSPTPPPPSPSPSSGENGPHIDWTTFGALRLFNSFLESMPGGPAASVDTVIAAVTKSLHRADGAAGRAGAVSLNKTIAINIVKNHLIGGGSVSVTLDGITAEGLASFAQLTPLQAVDDKTLKIGGQLGLPSVDSAGSTGSAGSADTVGAAWCGARRSRRPDGPSSGGKQGGADVVECGPINTTLRVALEWPTASPPLDSSMTATLRLTNLTFALEMDVLVSAERVQRLDLSSLQRLDCMLASLQNGTKINNLTMSLGALDLSFDHLSGPAAAVLARNTPAMSRQLLGLANNPKYSSAPVTRLVNNLLLNYSNDGRKTCPQAGAIPHNATPHGGGGDGPKPDWKGIVLGAAFAGAALLLLGASSVFVYRRRRQGEGTMLQIEGDNYVPLAERQQSRSSNQDAFFGGSAYVGEPEFKEFETMVGRGSVNGGDDGFAPLPMSRLSLGAHDDRGAVRGESSGSLSFELGFGRKSGAGGAGSAGANRPRSKSDYPHSAAAERAKSVNQETFFYDPESIPKPEHHWRSLASGKNLSTRIAVPVLLFICAALRVYSLTDIITTIKMDGEMTSVVGSTVGATELSSTFASSSSSSSSSFSASPVSASSAFFNATSTSTSFSSTSTSASTPASSSSSSSSSASPASSAASSFLYTPPTPAAFAGDLPWKSELFSNTLLNFTFGSMVTYFWIGGAWLISVLIVLGSACLPAVKILVMTYYWYVPANVTKRGRYLMWLDQLGNVAFLDAYLACFTTQVFNSPLDVDGIKVHMYGVPIRGIFGGITGTLLVAFLSTWMIAMHNSHLKQRHMLEHRPPGTPGGQTYSTPLHIKSATVRPFKAPLEIGHALYTVLQNRSPHSGRALCGRVGVLILLLVTTATTILCFFLDIASFKYTGVIADLSPPANDLRSYKMMGLALNLRASTPTNGAYYIVVLYLLMIVVAPALFLIATVVLWTVPMRVQWQQRIFTVLPSLFAFTGFDVLWMTTFAR